MPAGILEISLNMENRNLSGFFNQGQRITCLSFILVSVVVLLLSGSDSLGQTKSNISADILYSYFNTLYKLDQDLINGVKYYKPKESVSGTGFFLDDMASRGKITVNGKEYTNVFLKYDIVNQNVILEYDYPPGGKLQIIIDDEKVSDFEIFDKTFKKYDFPSTGSQFFQTISDGHLVCLISWRKILIPVGSSLQYTYQYSEEKKKTYLLRDDQLIQFGGQRSFLKLFPDFKKEIKQYIMRHHMEISTISDNQMAGLLEYCSGLSSSEPQNAIQ